MKYLEITFTCNPVNEHITDALSVYLGEIGFDSFIVEENKLLAYIPKDDFEENQLLELIDQYPFDVKIEYEINEPEDKNWNEEWENNYFSPIIIDDQCVIKSSFHKDTPNCKYTIIINPKMSFGTGHHQTTVLMLKEILKGEFNNKTVLDMGCGTGILAILASMRGAKAITAVDIDEWAFQNIQENIDINKTNNINIHIGDAQVIKDMSFDIIIANINRNVLLNDMRIYSESLNKNGILYLSGFYKEDIESLETEASKYGLQVCYSTIQDNWAALKLANNI